MARKELSPFAPDRRIREFHRRCPSLLADLRKGYDDPIRSLRPGSGVDEQRARLVRMPTMFPFLLLAARYGDPFCLSHTDELMKYTPFTGNVPPVSLATVPRKPMKVGKGKARRIMIYGTVRLNHH
ncbi:MAG: hypothetical protein E7576_09570 [Ruminococcaceae bacterium]|jgi:hypothetical protein|nr:hypothetical protein [Oscillospiraceae bacterium]